MTDEKNKPDAAESHQPGGPAGDEHDAQATETEALRAEVGKLEGQIKDLTDRLLRAHADMENFRKRTEREREETSKYAISKFAIDIVGMTDNFQRAIAAVPADAAAADPALQTLVDGVTMTEAEFLKVLERHGVKRIDPEGELFNPHFHQAMMEQQDTRVPAGTILQVFQPGYQIGDRCIRPAMVVVARGGAKAARGAGEAGKGGKDGPSAANNNDAPGA